MALVLMDGFDLTNGISYRGWTAGGTGAAIEYQTGSISGSCVRCRNTNGAGEAYIYKVLSSTYSEVVLGVRFQTEQWSLSTTNAIRLCQADTTLIASLRLHPTTGLISVVNSGGTTIATGFRPVVSNGWHYVEFRLKINGASGECEVMLDGTTEIATTVANFGSTNIGSLMFQADSNSSFSRLYVDDIYLVDTTGGAPLDTFLGDSHIETLLPTSDGANADWVPNSGSTEYTQVDENPFDGDTTYISDATPGDISTFGFSNLPFSSGTVYAAQTNLMARKDDATLREIRPVVRQGGVDYSVGTVVALSTTYALYTSLLPLDPVAAAWTPSNINGDEFGVELVT